MLGKQLQTVLKHCLLNLTLTVFIQIISLSRHLPFCTEVLTNYLGEYFSTALRLLRHAYATKSGSINADGLIGGGGCILAYSRAAAASSEGMSQQTRG
jgi:hypothetical protein